MKTASTTRKQYGNHRFNHFDRDRLAVTVFYAVNDQLDVMTFDEACSWVAEHWFNASIGEAGIRNLSYQGKRQRSRA